jgi:hypothetical protein
MSDLRVRCPLAWSTAVLALLLPSLAPTAAAQSTDDYRERVERLDARLERIRQEHTRAVGADTLPGDLDTLRVGPIRLLAPQPARRFVQAVAERLRDSLRLTVRGDSLFLPSLMYLIRPSRRGLAPFRFEGVGGWVYGDQDSPGREPDSPDHVASGLLGMLRGSAAQSLDSTMRRWLEGSLPLDTLTEIQAHTVYIELATKPLAVSGACYAGQLDRCREALAVGTGGAEAWYTDEERRQLVASAMAWHRGVQRDPGARLCATTGDEPACTEILQTYPNLVQEPLSPMARQTLVRVAFESGGEGAFGRLMTGDSLALPDRLARTAGLPVDSLIARWHAAIIAARPAGTVLSRAGGWTAFLWVVVLGVLAMRGTRWRIQ